MVPILLVLPFAKMVKLKNEPMIALEFLSLFMITKCNLVTPTYRSSRVDEESDMQQASSRATLKVTTLVVIMQFLLILSLSPLSTL